MTGPNILPIAAVPRGWTRKKRTSIGTVTGGT